MEVPLARYDRTKQNCRCARLPLSTFFFPVVALTSPAMGRKKKRNKAARLAPAPTKPVPARRSRWPWICLGLILLFVVVVRVRLLPVPLERDEGEYAYAGQLILDGIPPYQLVYNVKLPGIYAAYASLMAIFGQTTFGFIWACSSSIWARSS